MAEEHQDGQQVGDQILWRYGGDLRFFLVVGQVAVLQMMHPAFSSVVAQNSLFFHDVWRRWFERTSPMLQGALFADDPVAVSREMRDIHKGIKGIDDSGKTWHALDPNVFHFAHASQYYAVWQMIELFCGRTLTEQETEAYYQATRKVWRQFGMRMDVSPPDWDSFLVYFDDFVASELRSTTGAQEMLDFFRSAPAPPVHGLPERMWGIAMRPAFGQYARLCIGLLPPTARKTLGVSWTKADERWLRELARGVRVAGRVLPQGVLISPQARSARFGHPASLSDRVQLAAGEAVQRPVSLAWRLATH